MLIFPPFFGRFTFGNTSTSRLPIRLVSGKWPSTMVEKMAMRPFLRTSFQSYRRPPVEPWPNQLILCSTHHCLIVRFISLPHPRYPVTFWSSATITDLLNLFFLLLILVFSKPLNIVIHNLLFCVCRFWLSAFHWSICFYINRGIMNTATAMMHPIAAPLQVFALDRYLCKRRESNRM